MLDLFEELTAEMDTRNTLAFINPDLEELVPVVSGKTSFNFTT